MRRKKLPQLKISNVYFFAVYRYDTVDVSVAVATPSGLITPIIFNADSKVRVTSPFKIVQSLASTYDI